MAHQQRFGVKNGNSKLTPEQVAMIERSEMSQRELARRFGVSQSCISKIKRGVTWQAASTLTN